MEKLRGITPQSFHVTDVSIRIAAGLIVLGCIGEAVGITTSRQKIDALPPCTPALTQDEMVQSLPERRQLELQSLFDSIGDRPGYSIAREISVVLIDGTETTDPHFDVRIYRDTEQYRVVLPTVPFNSKWARHAPPITPRASIEQQRVDVAYSVPTLSDATDLVEAFASERPWKNFQVRMKFPQPIPNTITSELFTIQDILSPLYPDILVQNAPKIETTIAFTNKNFDPEQSSTSFSVPYLTQDEIEARPESRNFRIESASPSTILLTGPEAFNSTIDTPRELTPLTQKIQGIHTDFVSALELCPERTS